MADLPSFTVRPLPPSPSLDGAFRVHIPTKDLELLGLRPGDLCQLNAADGTVGIGIAWRSIEQSAKPQAPHPVKLTDHLRDAFGFKLGNQLTIQKANTKIVHADRVVVIDVTDPDNIDPQKDDKNWKWRCGQVLGNVEAVAPGVAFEIASRKGLKKRFLIEDIESRSQNGNALFFFDDFSELALQDEESTPSPVPSPAANFVISSEGIGGLHRQIELLNKRMTRLITNMRGKKLPPRIQRNGAILLYGPEGTGKSLLLDHLAKAPWRKVIRIDQSTVVGTTSKAQQAMRTLFAQAVSQQPSVVIIDNLETIAGVQTRDSIALGSLVPTLMSEMDRLKNTQVLLVAATHSPNDIDKSLRSPGRFRYEIEIPIPDVKARIEILKALQGPGPELDRIAEVVGERTHGFVGQDLEALYNNALEQAWERDDDIGEWTTIPNPSDRTSDAATLVDDGRSMRTCTTSRYLDDRTPAPSRPVSSEDVPEIYPSLEDYERALLEVRPTAMREVFLEKPNVQWSEIGGSAQVQQMLNEVVEWPLKYAHHMQALNLDPQKGILLYGPPGCSKTLTAKAVATSSGLNFIAVKGAELTSMYVGESERAVREVFRKARAASPSIIFFDEIDSIGSERDSAGTKGLNVLTTLLNEMDGIESLKGVIVLAATNKPEILDPALLRPGRFDSLIYIAPPSAAARLEILRIRTRAAALAPDVDLAALARDTEGYSGAEIVNICLEATRSTMRRRVQVFGAHVPELEAGVGVEGDSVSDELKVTRRDFDAALEKMVRRITPEMTAAYEAWRDGLGKQ